MRPLRVLGVALLSLFAAVILAAVGSGVYLLNSPAAAGRLMDLLAQLSDGTLHYRTASGPIGGPLLLEDLVYEDPNLRLQVSRLRLDWSLPALLRGQIRVRHLEAGALLLQLKQAPARTPARPALTRLPLALVLEQLSIESFSLTPASGKRAHTVEDIRLVAGWSGDRIRIQALQARHAEIGTLQLHGTLQLQPRALALQELVLSGPGELQLDGVIGYDGQVQAGARWTGLRWPQQGPPRLQSARGEAQIEGSWQDFALELQADAVLAPLSAAPAQMVGRGRGSSAGLQLTELEVKTLGGSVRASGALHWLPAFSASGRGEFAGLNPQALAPQWTGRLNGTFDGRIEALHPLRGELSLNLGDAQLRGKVVQLAARAEARDDTLMLKQFELHSGASRLRINGALWPQLDAAAELDSPELGELWPGLAGKAEARLRLRGTREFPHLVADAHLQQLAYAQLAVADTVLKLDLSARAPSTFRLELRDARAGVPIERVTLTGTGTVARNTFMLESRTAIGNIQMNFAGALDLRALRWQGELRSGRGEPQRLSSWTLQEPAALSLGLDVFDLAPACWRSSDGRACVQLHQQAAGLRAGFRLEQLALAYFEPLLPPGWTVSGAISGTGLLQRRAGRTQAQTDLSTGAGVLAIGGTEVLRFAPSRWLAEETATGFVSRLQLPLADGGIYWDALLSAAPEWSARRWSGELRADLASLQPLRLLSPELESVSGELHGRFAISGSAGAPRLDGALRLRDGRLRLTTPAIELTALSADLAAEARTGLLRFSAQAQSGGGELRVKGSADAARLGDSVKLEISGENFQAAATAQARVWVSPQLKFTLDPGRADLSGEIRVPRADITPTGFDRGAGPSSDQIIIGANGASSQTGLLKVYSNVRISLGDDVRFDGLGLSTQLAGGLQAQDEPGRPTTARGEVRLQGGRYTAYGQDLNIQTGRLIFNGGPITQPALEIRAQRQPSDQVTVGLYVRGLLTAPQFNLYSTPAMPQEQQLSWLVLGRPLQEPGRTSGADRSALSGAALSLGLSGGNFLAQKLGGGLPLDEISIGAKAGETSDQARLTLGKYLSPKLFVSYGIGLFQPGQAFRLLYDIGYGFKLSTESGVESGGDVIYTIEK